MGSNSSSPNSPTSSSESFAETQESLRPVKVATYHSSRWQNIQELPPWDHLTRPIPSSLQIISWNIDFMGSSEISRLRAALIHLRTDILHCPNPEDAPEPCCILLQEVVEPTFHRAILEDPWVRDHFHLIPDSPGQWTRGARYGNVTLVSNTVPLAGAFFVDFEETLMSRGAPIVDVNLSVPGGDADSETEPESVESGSRTPDIVKVRIANVHLESLPVGAEERQHQIKVMADVLGREGVFAGVVCGDMNAIGDSDRGLPESVGLVDAWKGGDDDETGFTWGYQPKCRFAPGRLDKICHTSAVREGVSTDSGVSATPTFTVDVPRRIGVGLKTPNHHWVSDHYGLSTMLRILQRTKIRGILR